MHDWNVTPQQAISIQQILRQRIVQYDHLPEITSVAGVDLSYESTSGMCIAAVAVLDFPALSLREFSIARCQTNFPYVPGLLSFREIPAALEAIAKLKQLPQLILCDGQGYAHPRRFGLACHLGLLTEIATIGVAKTRLIGEHRAISIVKGATVPLTHLGEQIGVVLRSRRNVKPLYISIGHKIGLPSAIDYVMRCVTAYRLPETTRWADRLAAEHKQHK